MHTDEFNFIDNINMVNTEKELKIMIQSVINKTNDISNFSISELKKLSTASYKVFKIAEDNEIICKNYELLTLVNKLGRNIINNLEIISSTQQNLLNDNIEYKKLSDKEKNNNNDILNIVNLIQIYWQIIDDPNRHHSSISTNLINTKISTCLGEIIQLDKRIIDYNNKNIDPYIKQKIPDTYLNEYINIITYMYANYNNKITLIKSSFNNLDVEMELEINVLTKYC